MKMVGMVDLGYTGSIYTLENKQEGIMLIKECLDWAVASK